MAAPAMNPTIAACDRKSIKKPSLERKGNLHIMEEESTQVIYDFLFLFLLGGGVISSLHISSDQIFVYLKKPSVA